MRFGAGQEGVALAPWGHGHGLAGALCLLLGLAALPGATTGGMVPSDTAVAQHLISPSLNLGGKPKLWMMIL